MRSATQATDSTWSGCSAKSAATTALRQVAPVSHRSQPKSNSAFVRCSSTLVAWWPRRLEPVDLRVEHVREVGDRMPIELRLEEGPAQAVETEPVADVVVLGDEARVVVAHELEADRRGVHCRGGEAQRKGDPGDPSRGAHDFSCSVSRRSQPALRSRNPQVASGSASATRTAPPRPVHQSGAPALRARTQSRAGAGT